MAIWVWDGFIQADIPNHWSVRDERNLIECLPPEPVGALQISMFQVPGFDLQAECAAAIANFIEKQAGRAKTEPRIGERDGCLTVTIEFESGQADQRLSWVISAVGCGQMIALATYCYGKDEDVRVKEAAQIIESIRTDTTTKIPDFPH